MYCRLFALAILCCVGNGVGAKSVHAALALHRTLDNPDPDLIDWFGDHVDVSDDYVLVGAQAFGMQQVLGGNAGQAHLFDVHTGDLLHTIDDPDLVTDDFFGRLVAISGDRLLVGAYSHNFAAGQVHLFDAVSGQRLRTFHVPGAGDSYFPSALAIDGDFVLIGTVGGQRFAGNSFTAQVFLFDAPTGALLHTFDGPAGAFGFGRSLAISGNTIVLGAPNNGLNGSVYVYDATSGGLVDSWGDASLYGFDSLATDSTKVLIGHNRFDGQPAIEGEAAVRSRRKSAAHLSGPRQSAKLPRGSRRFRRTG